MMEELFNIGAWLKGRVLILLVILAAVGWVLGIKSFLRVSELEQQDKVLTDSIAHSTEVINNYKGQADAWHAIADSIASQHVTKETIRLIEYRIQHTEVRPFTDADSSEQYLFKTFNINP